MNRTHRITSDWLLQSGLVEEELLLEALLRRGFLAYRDDQGVWLGTGSHPADLDVLRLVTGLKVEPVSDHKDRKARVKMRSTRVRAMDVALAIVVLFESYSSFTTGGIPGFLGSNGWNSYRTMAWGAKLPIGPTMKGGINCQAVESGVLDLGVALLVKVLPLARVATSISCDGHGERPATIPFCFEWDPFWAKAVFDVLDAATPKSIWSWNGGIEIAPSCESQDFSDAEVLGMLNDIQHFARRLLDQITIDKIGRARAGTLEAFGDYPPIHKHFAEEARRQLAAEFN
jgi:hypothetical protein